MGSKASSSGYTILETLIFLAVSGVLFVSAMTLVNGRQARAEFTSAVREFELELTDIAGNVAAGYYSTSGTMTCDTPGTDPPLVTSAATPLGTNEKCVFMGRVMQFAPNDGNASTTTDAETYNVYTAVGRRYDASGTKDAENITEARPVLIAPGMVAPSTTRPDMIDRKKLSGGARVEKITIGGTTTQVGGFGFFNNLHVTNQGAITKSGSLQVDVVVPNPGVPAMVTGLNETSTAFVHKMDSLSANMPLVNPSGGLVICLRSGGTSQHALINLGTGNAGKLTTSMTIGPGNCP